METFSIFETSEFKSIVEITKLELDKHQKFSEALEDEPTTKLELSKHQKLEDEPSPVSDYLLSPTITESSSLEITQELANSVESLLSLKDSVSLERQSTSPQDVSSSVSLERQSTSQDVSSGVLETPELDYRDENLPSTSSEGSIQYEEKNDEDAKRFLNNAQEESNYRKKMKLLNQCLAAARSSETQVEAYINRAELLCCIKEQDLAVLDTNRAYALLDLLEESRETKEKLREKLEKIERSARIELSRNRLDFRRIAIEYPFELVMPRSKIRRVVQFSRKIEEPKARQVDETVYEDSLAKDWEFHENWRVNAGDPPQRLSPKVELVYDDEKGWHWRAKEEIPVGEPLSTQDYFAVKMSPETLYFYCSYCTIWFLALIPCKSCRTEMYCSESCRNKAYDLYHETECKLLPHLSNLKERELTLLALRIFLVGTKKGEELRQSPPLGLESQAELYKCMFKRKSIPEGRMSLNEYRTVLSLFWKTEEAKSFTEVLDPNFQYDVIKVFVALRRIDNFFESLCINVFSFKFYKEEMLALVLLVQNLALLSYNHSAIHAQYFGEKDIDNNPRTKYIGLGLHTLHSLLNNSCNPRAAIMRDRRRELVFAVRRIAVGEEIDISYIDDYGKRYYDERKMALMYQYKIKDCYCEACQKRESWIPCRMGDETEEDEKFSVWRTHFEHFLEGRIELSEENLEYAFSFKKTHTQHEFKDPSRITWLCESVIKELMPTLRGNFRTLKRLKEDPSLPPPPTPAPDSASSRRKVSLGTMPPHSSPFRRK